MEWIFPFISYLSYFDGFPNSHLVSVTHPGGLHAVRPLPAGELRGLAGGVARRQSARTVDFVPAIQAV